MQAGTFDVAETRKNITVFKIGSRWIFKHYFDGKDIFRELVDHYDKDIHAQIFSLLSGQRTSWLGCN
jgi:hypothetical protein